MKPRNIINNYSTLDSKKARIEKIRDLYQAELDSLEKQADKTKNPEKISHYTTKKDALLRHLKTANIIDLIEEKKLESKSYAFANSIDVIQAKTIKKLRTDMEDDKEGINKKRRGFYYFHSTTLKQLTVTNNKVINILEAPEKIQKIYEAQISFLLIKRNFYGVNTEEYNHYDIKYRSLLGHLSKAGIINTESKSEADVSYTFNEDLTSISIDTIKTLQREIENDKEGVNKRLIGFFFNSSTAKDLIDANNEVISILKDIDISHQLALQTAKL